MRTWLNLETKFLTRDLTWPFQKNLNLHFGFASGLFHKILRTIRPDWDQGSAHIQYHYYPGSFSKSSSRHQSRHRHLPDSRAQTWFGNSLIYIRIKWNYLRPKFSKFSSGICSQPKAKMTFGSSFGGPCQ